MQDRYQEEEKERKSLHVAAQLNNTAASLIEARKFKAAVNLLNQTLSICEPYIESWRLHVAGSKVLSSSSDGLDFHLGKYMKRPEVLVGRTCDSISSRLSCCKRLKDVDDDVREGAAGTYIYRHPIFVPCNSLAELLADKNQHDTANAAINLSLIGVFNMALAYNLFADALQLQGHSAGISHQALCKSSRLYELAYSILVRYNVACCSLFLTALVNNLGQNFKLMDKKENANKVFRQLLPSLIHLTGDYRARDMAI